MLPPVLAAALVLTASAGAATPLRVMGFGGSSNWPIFVAQENGLFARHGLEVELSTARDSTTQLADLAEGRIDVAMTAFDNVVAWDERHDRARAIVAFLGVNNGGRSSLVAAPRIAGIPDLLGGRLGVDALASGYALLLQERQTMSRLEKCSKLPSITATVSASSVTTASVPDIGSAATRLSSGALRSPASDERPFLRWR